MGTIKQGILGGFSGKVAGVVGSSWKGIAVVKSLPLSVANPKTAGQVAQRSAFKGATQMGSTILAPIVKPLWDRFAQKASGYNDFVAANVGAFDASGVPTAADLVMSRGSLQGEPIAFMDGNNADPIVSVQWDDASGVGNALATDEVYVVVINETQNVTKGFVTGNTRTDTEAQVTMDADSATGDSIQAYLSFRRPDGTIVSDSTTRNKIV